MWIIECKIESKNIDRNEMINNYCNNQNLMINAQRMIILWNELINCEEYLEVMKFQSVNAQ